MTDFHGQLSNPQPASRTSNTFQSSIFKHEAKQANRSPEPQQSVCPPYESTLFPRTVTPTKIRQTPTNQSNVFSDVKEAQSKSGKKVFQIPSSIFTLEPEKRRRSPVQHPLKQLDQPLSSFYQLESQTCWTKPRTHHSPEHSKKHIYHDKTDTLTSMTTQERRLNGESSNIFHQNMKQYTTERVQDQKLYPNTMSKWYDPRLCSKTSQVNENAVFNKDYSKVKKQEDYKSSAIPNTIEYPKVEIFNDNQQTYAPAIEDPNEGIKKKNQNFSDIFDLQYGDKELKHKVRSLSPTLKWNQHDSIRDSKQISPVLYTPISKSRTQINLNVPVNQVVASKFGQERLSENHLNCHNTIRAMKGEQSTEGQISRHVVVGRNEQNTYRQPLEPAYTGLFSWKNNYKKKK